jgi:alkyl hydroperoxide reductase subunit F
MLDTNLNFNFQPQKEQVTFNQDDLFDVLVIGGGPAGLNAALYAKRKGNHVGIVTGIMGGQVMNTSVVENYLGLKTVSGTEMVDAFVEHLSELQVPVLEYVMVDTITTENNIHTLHLTDGTTVSSKTVILATGSQSRKLQVPGEDEFAGRGVAYCAICDAPLYKGKDVLIAGGGNAAVEAAIDLSKIANSVTIVHRSQFRADQILVEQLNTKTNVTIHLETQVLEIVGQDFVTGVLAKDKASGELKEIKGDGIFIEIGHIPNTETFRGIVDLNDHGEVITDEKKLTSVPGIFAAGDMTDVPYKQIIIATAEGATAALSANEYLNKFESMTEATV